jgi:hypothetical protein
VRQATGWCDLAQRGPPEELKMGQRRGRRVVCRVGRQAPYRGL